MTIDELLQAAAVAHPTRHAIIDRERRVTYRELAALVEQTAAMLAGHGVGPGDVVSFQLPNWLEASILFFATIRLRAVSNPIVPIYRGREMAFVLRQTKARVLVIPDVFRRFDYRTMVANLRSVLPDLAHVLVVGEPGSVGESFTQRSAPGVGMAIAPANASDIALVLYTSGTEAEPKGVLHSHETLLYECQSIIDLYSLTSEDRIFMPSPLSHITGLLYGIILPTMLGTTVVLQDIWDALHAHELIDHERLTFCVGATPFLHGLVEAHGAGGSAACHSLKVFACGGADVPPSLIRAAQSRLGVTASRVYGSTECPTSTGTPVGAPLESHADTDGSAIGATEVRVVSGDGSVAQTGARGHLQVRGPDLCLGYLEPRLNEAAFSQDGWFRTGDLAEIDAGGRVKISGRAKDIIVRGGENLSAKELEDLLFDHPAIREVAVVGYADNVLGERTCAFVVADRPMSLAEVVTFLRGREIAVQKLPERLELVSELPKTASGKVQKFRLREWLHGNSPSDHS